jgi:hypothetical protein
MFDTPFRRWIASIDPAAGDMDLKCNGWLIHARATLLGLGEDMIRDLGDNAFVGKNSSVNAPNAYSRFLYKLFNIVPKDIVGEEA